MDDISMQIRRLKRLGTPQLELTGRQLISIPAEVYTLNLTHMDLSDNRITSLESKITTMTNLKVINLSNNCIEEVPEELLNMTSLQQLILNGNPLNAKFQPLLLNNSQPQLGQTLQKIFQVSPGTQSIFQEQHRVTKSHQEQVRPSTAAAQQKYNPTSDSKVMEVDHTEFEIGEVISQGGFSLVHRGSLRGTEIAVKKVFNPNITQQLLDEFNNEIEMLNYLRHPNIVLLMAVCTKSPNLCIATELVAGGSLFQLLHKSKYTNIQTSAQLTDQVKFSISIQIARAICYMHLSGVLHRDIKSHNVLLQGQTAKLCDFGLARKMNELNTGTQQFSGTPTYMAPELFAKKAYDKGVDLFAFGTLLWEIFAREVPFEGLDVQDIIQRVMRSEQLPCKNNMPKHICQLANDLRQKDESRRPNMESVLQILKKS